MRENLSNKFSIRNKIKEKFNINSIDIYVFFGMLIFTSIICYNFLKIHFAADTYWYKDYSNYIVHFLNSARLFGALELWISKILDISLLTNLKLLSILAIITISIAWFILYKYIIKLCNKEKSIFYNILIGMISFAIIFNFSSCEMFVFAESGVMCLSILFAVIASCIFNSNIKNRYILSLIFVIMSSFAYQSSISLFVLLALIMEAYKNRGNIKKIIGEALIIGVFYGGALVLNLIIVKIIENLQHSNMRKTAIPSLIDIMGTISKYGAEMACDTFKLFPKNSYIIAIISITIWFIYMVYKRKDYFAILEYIVLILLAFIMPLLPVIVTPISKQYLEPRMSLSFASILGVLVLYITIKFIIGKKLTNINKKILTIISIIIFTSNAMYFVRASSENMASGYLDRNVAKSIIEEIYEYQNKNNIKVENIGIAYDSKAATYYNGQPELESINVRSMVIEWSAINVIEFYSGEEYNRVKTPKEIQDKFLKHDWDFYSPEQLVFEGNTLYICLY